MPQERLVVQDKFVNKNISDIANFDRQKGICYKQWLFKIYDPYLI